MPDRRRRLRRILRPRPSLSKTELAELRQQIDACQALLVQCARDLAAIEHRLVGIQQRSSPIRARSRRPPLTPRETEVLQLLGRELSNREIARELGVRLGTVRNHVTSIIGKLGTHDRHETVARAQVLGLI